MGVAKEESEGGVTKGRFYAPPTDLLYDRLEGTTFPSCAAPTHFQDPAAFLCSHWPQIPRETTELNPVIDDVT